MEAQNKIDQKNGGGVSLADRLDHASKRLWNEDRISAVEVQVVVEEAKAELKRLEKLTQSHSAQLLEARRLGREEAEGANKARLTDLESRLHQAQQLNASLKDSLAQERSRVERQFQELEAREQEITQFREKYLKAETERDSVRAKKMEEFARETEAKASEMESLWAQRHHQLEADHRKRREDLERNYEDLLKNLEVKTSEVEAQYHHRESALAESRKKLETTLRDREARCAALETALHKQGSVLTERAAELEEDYTRKRAELTSLKEGMQQEIAALIQRYPAARSGAARLGPSEENG